MRQNSLGILPWSLWWESLNELSGIMRDACPMHLLWRIDRYVFIYINDDEYLSIQFNSILLRVTKSFRKLIGRKDMEAGESESKNRSSLNFIITFPKFSDNRFKNNRYYQVHLFVEIFTFEIERNETYCHDELLPFCLLQNRPCTWIHRYLNLITCHNLERKKLSLNPTSRRNRNRLNRAQVRNGKIIEAARRSLRRTRSRGPGVRKARSAQ